MDLQEQAKMSWLLQNVFLLTLLARFRVEFSVGGVLFSNCDEELTLAPLTKHLSGHLTFNFMCYRSAEMSPEARFIVSLGICMSGYVFVNFKQACTFNAGC